MHSTTETLLEVFAGGADSATHPGAVAHELEAVVPNIQQVVLIDIALSEGAVDVRTGGYVAVEQHRADVDARTAEEVAVAHLFLVLASICLAAEFQVDAALFACGGDELQHLLHLCTAEHQLVVACRPSDGRDGEQPPVPDSVGNEQLF